MADKKTDADILDASQIICEDLDLPQVKYVVNTIKLFEAENSIPFIARYRKKQTGGMDPGKLRELKSAYDTYRSVKKKAEIVLQKLGETASHALKDSLSKARTVNEIDELYAPFKKGGKGTRAERARKLGLDSLAQQLLDHPERLVDFAQYVRVNQEGPQNVKEVQAGIQDIVADIISKNQETLDAIKNLIKGSIVVETKTSEAKQKLDKNKKFQMYYDWHLQVDKLKSHQILAINRGEEQKILSVKFVIRDRQRDDCIKLATRKWIRDNALGQNRSLLKAAIEDSFKRLIEKSILRRTRSQLTGKAQRESVEIFSENLKRLLLASPIKGTVVLGIDPGFKHGCKLAVLDANGAVLETGVIHPFGSSNSIAKKCLQRLVQCHRIEIIAIGNGTACRETETFVSVLIKDGSFKPLDVVYCIVNESGASIYSVTKEAEAEFPKMDPNIRSAVSIGRRLQDPLLELVKIEPKHIGVGMYQHDVSQTLLQGALDGVVEDCVSFVGVDINACSATILRRIAGLNAKRAESIIKWRTEHGPFVNRRQLLQIKGLGEKTFEQCAGFIRVSSHNSVIKIEDDEHPEVKSVGKKRKLTGKGKSSSKKQKLEENLKPEPLDQTWIHPESYDVTYRLLKMVGAQASMIGTSSMKAAFDFINSKEMKDYCTQLDVDEETLSLIVKGLKQPLGYDIRQEMEKPVFKKGVQSMSDLKLGQIVSGLVTNVTSFGVFVDCGVGRDGLIHSSKLHGCKTLGPGDKVDCKVLDVDINRSRINLELITSKKNAPELR